MGEGNLSEGVDGAHVWLQLPAFDQRAQLVELAAVLPGEDEVVTRVAAPSLDQVLRLRDVHDRHHAPQLRQDVRAACQGIATDGVEDHVDALAPGFPLDDIDIILMLIVDDHVRAHLPHEFGIGLAHGGEHPCAHGLGQLDRHVADTTCAAVNQDALAHPERRTHYQGLPGRAADQAQAGCLQVAQRRRLQADDVFGGDVVLGIAARPVEDLRRVPHLVARPERGHTRPDGFDHAGNVVPGNGREGHQVGVVATPNLVIQGVDGGGVHPDQHLSGLRHRFGDIAIGECVRAAKGIQYQRFHGPLANAPDFDQACTLQGGQVVGHRRLRQPDAFLDAAHTDAHGMNVTFVLGRKVFHRVFQAFEDLETGTVRECLEYVEQFHGAIISGFTDMSMR
ncbi:hypothetical protein WR25_09234 [Diploscapter pachys]|uniref:Uncharacterized protein n=1 Tax=Diploscapter pachys TaxID=2018661 RepID=A0A2A2M2T2_9BILA|nr:hypothetical protein WR25_09234 [Diploscapter pachys]